MSDIATDTQPTTAHAFLGTSTLFHTFRMNPDSASWNYTENVQSTDTIGGRVVQLLSVNIDGVVVQGRAGSRAELQRLAENVRRIMTFHTRTQKSVRFKVPSRKWDFEVFVQAMPQMGWEVASTSYPYQLGLAVVEDLSGVQSYRLQKKALGRLAEGIGYNPGVHGGDAQSITELVKTIAGIATPTTIAAGAIDKASAAIDTAFAKGIEGALAFADTCTSCPRNPRLMRCQASLSAKFGRDIQHVCSCVCKNVLGSSTPSQHSYGNAMDIFSRLPGGAQSSVPDHTKQAVAAYLHDNAKQLQVAELIYNHQDSWNGGEWGPYTGTTNPHTDHVHVDFLPQQSGPCR